MFELRITYKPFFMCFLIFSFLLFDCTTHIPPLEDLSSSTHTPIIIVTTTVAVETTFPTHTNTTSPTKLSPSPTPAPTFEPEGCRKPVEIYNRVYINNHILNQRTFSMLEYAQTLYDGPIDITGYAITQGSYTSAVEASFGTHAGGGAVDLSVIARESFKILHHEIEPLIRSLRLAGFAAWYRDLGDLYPGSPVHIHAIAIGDQELSPAARDQLTGYHGYFLGYNGLPSTSPQPDPHGGPIICDWMVEMGYLPFPATPKPGALNTE